MMYQGILHRWITYPIHSHHNHKDIVLDIRHANNSLHFSLTTITSYRLLGLSVYKKVVIIISGDYRKRGDCKTNSPKLILGMQSHSESITINLNGLIIHSIHKQMMVMMQKNYQQLHPRMSKRVMVCSLVLSINYILFDVHMWSTICYSIWSMVAHQFSNTYLHPPC